MKKKTTKKINFLIIAVSIFALTFPFYDKKTNTAKAANFLNDETNGWEYTPTFNYPSDDARIGHSAVYSNFGGKNEMIIFGGKGNNGTYNDVWILDLNSKNWREIKSIPGDPPESPPEEECVNEDFQVVPCEPLPLPQTGPAKRLEHAAAYDPASDTMYIFGGWQLNGPVFGDLWALQNLHSNPIWKKQPPITGLDYGLRGSSAVWDSANSRLIIFGGVRDDSRISGLTIKFNPSNSTYQYVAKDSIKRYKHSAIWTGNEMIIFGGRKSGTGDASYLNDTWKLTGGANWSEIITSNNPAKRQGAKAFYDVSSNQMFIFGGDTVGSGYDNNSFVLNLTGQKLWTAKTLSNPPSARHDYGSVYNGKDEIWVYGGREFGGNKMSDIHKLKFLTPPTAPALNKIESSCIGNSNPDNIIYWNDNSDNETSFEIYRLNQQFTPNPVNPTEGTPVLLDFHNSGSVTGPQIFTDTSPAAQDQDITYYYRVLARNGTEWSLSGAVSIATKNCKPTANPQSPSTNEDTPLSITLSGSDYESKPLTYTITTTPSHGALSGDAPNLTYTPSANYYGPDNFNFTVTDSNGGVSAPAAVSITVNTMNDSPVLAPIGNKTALETENLSFAISATDIDSPSLTYSASNLPTGASFEPTTKTFSWTPTYDQGNSKPTNYTGVVFTVSDGTLTASETIQITVNNKNRAPTANAQSVSVTKNTPKIITLIGTDPDGDALTYTPSTPPCCGTLTKTGTAPGEFTFNPQTDYVGTQGDFTFSVNDGTANSNDATVDITISNPNPQLYSLSINGLGSGAGKITSSPAGINCAIDNGTENNICSYDFEKNSTIILTAAPNTGNHKFINWNNCAPIVDRPLSCTITIIKNETVDAKFYLSTLTITPTTAYLYPNFGAHTYQAYYDEDGLGNEHSEINTINSNPRIDNFEMTWSSGATSTAKVDDSFSRLGKGFYPGSVIIYSGYKGVIATGNLTIHNNPLLSITIAGNGKGAVTTSTGLDTGLNAGINCGNGNNNCSESYTYGTGNISINAAPDENSLFAGLSGDTDCSDNLVSMVSTAGNDKEATPTANRNCTATFNLKNQPPGDGNKPNASISIKALDNLTDIDKSLIGEVFYANVKNSNAPAGKSLNKVSFCFDNTPSNDTCDGDIWNEYLWGQTNGSWDAGPAKSLTLTGILTRLGTWAVYVKVKDSSDVWSDIAKDTVQMAPLLSGIPNCPADYTARADLSWIKPNQAENDSTGIQILRTTGGADGTYTQIGPDLINTAISYQDTNVSVSTSYHYKIRYLRAGDNTDSNPKNIVTTACAPGPGSNWYINITPLNHTANPGDSKYYSITVSATNFTSPVTIYLNKITVDGRNLNDIEKGFTKDFNTYTNTLNLSMKNGVYESGYFGIKDKQITDLRGNIFYIELLADKLYSVYFYINQRPNAYFHTTTPVSGNSPMTVNFKDGKLDGTPSDGGKDGDKIWWADGKDIVLHLGNLNGNKNADGSEMWDHCYSTTLSIDCKNIVTEELPDGESYRSDSWNFTYTESAQAKYCIFDNLILNPDTKDPKLSMDCANPIDITINPKPAAESKNITVEKNSIKNTISLNGIPNNKSFVYKITNLPTNGILYDQNTEKLTACSEDSPCVLNNLSPLTSINTFYTPNTEYIGPDKFTFKVNNGEQDSDNGTTSITVVNNETNQAPVAEASFTLGGQRNCNPDNGQSGNICSFSNPLIVNQGEAVNIVSFNADIDTNGDGKASYDPNGWTDADFGVSNSGKCEWDKDFSGVYDSPAIENPPSPAGCNINSSFDITFNNSFNNDETELLKITDNKGITGSSKVKVIVRPPPIPNQAPIAEASFLVNGERYSYNRPLIVDVGNTVTITSFDAHIDVNGDGKASDDPNGWTDADFGVSNSGKCEWDKDFSGVYDEIITNPPEPINCSISGSFKITFNTPSANQINGDPFTILKITDKGSLFGDSAVRVLVKEGGGNKPNLIISAGPTVNSGDLTENSLITFKGTINNNGNENATNGFLNEFGIDLGNDGSIDDRLPKININKLNTGDSKEIISGNWRAVRGTHRITLCADSDNSINESNETDNCNPGNIIITIDPPCAKECEPDGSKTCVTDNSFKTCGNFDSDICLELGPETNCGAGETCVQKGNDIQCLLLPVISFSANPTTIKKGESSTLTWNTENIIPSNGDTCTASNSNNYNEWKGNVESIPNGNKLVTPAKTTEYTLTCRNSLPNSEVSESVTIRVQSKPPIEI